MLRNKSILQHKDDDAHNLFNLAYHRIALVYNSMPLSTTANATSLSHVSPHTTKM